MRYAALALISVLSILSSCKKQVPCDTQDLAAVCKAFQQCLRSDTSTEVCRMAEQDANKIGKGASHIASPTKH